MLHLLKKVSFGRLIAVVVMLVTLPSLIILAQRQIRLKSEAAASPGQAEFSFSAPVNTMPPNQTLSLKLDSAIQGVSFLRADIVFDPTKTQMTGEVTTTSLFKTKMTVTSMDHANASGRLTIMLSLAPDDAQNPPRGQFEVAQIPIGTVSSTANDTATWSVDSSHSEVVDISNSQDLQIVIVPLDLTLNYARGIGGGAGVYVALPVATSTPSPTPIPVSNPTATPGPNSPATPNYCNGTCGSDSNCQPGLTCYLGFCRNPNNLSDVNCNDKAEPNGCNGTCGSNTNCLSGLTCYQGRCRNPNYPTSATCTFQPSPTPRKVIALKPEPTVTLPFGARKTVTTVWPTPTKVPIIPTPAPVVYNSADVNYDECVSLEDVRLILFGWLGGGSDSTKDVNRDGRVDLKDLWYALLRLGEGCNV